MRLANSSASARMGGLAPPVVYVEPGAAATITSPVLLAVEQTSRRVPDFFQTMVPDGRISRRQVSYFSRPTEGSDLAGGDIANGLHTVVARQASGMPQGEQIAWPVAQRSTLFRSPEPWDRGASRATPGAVNTE